MLTKQNSGKYLTKEYAEKYEIAMTDPSKLSAKDLEWLGIANPLETSPNNDRVFEVQTVPIEPGTRKGKIDVRDVTGRR